jgi:hypothetical protein
MTSWISSQVSPLQGSEESLRRPTQGVALGYRVTPHLGLKTAGIDWKAVTPVTSSDVCGVSSQELFRRDLSLGELFL